MTKEKKSFMEKLIGSRRVEDDIDHSSRHSIHPTPVVEDEFEDISIPESRMETSQNNFSDNWSSAQSMESDESGDGQLTIDVYQTDEDVVIKSTIAGVNPEDLDVSINNDMITIRGERKFEEEVSEENFYYQECYWGSFSRSVVLPVDVIAEKIEASLKNGILTIRLPKADTNKTKKIKVRGF
ncbi:MAG: Hsp20/alpha crystallin family protein [Candidatus Moranbacteria bacterium]|jgi:HSP20 family protein|nr:Hsp20/alpha crystallin family protein [Candidatus Moranbacteria bacterium]NCA94303.1 Hsp20/alpha crystallin family protein [Sphingobacteriia bacterium]NLC31321.1 Hsp20/alpha crystallin family protein [Candidatus Moranbacteria bacterium]